MINNYKTYADHFYNLGLNVVCVSDERNEFNLLDNNLLKSPNHKWNHLVEERQTENELNSYKWDEATGLGLVLGFNNLIAIDIDGSIDIEIAYAICNLLNISNHYYWLMKSGSGCGFHIILRCDDFFKEKTNQKNLIDNNKFDNFGYDDVDAFYPKTYSLTYEELSAEEDRKICNLKNVNGRCVKSPVIFKGKFTNAIYEYEEHIDEQGDVFDSGRMFQFIIDEAFDKLNISGRSVIQIRQAFTKIEFIWKGILMLPPSLHETGQHYLFNSKIPSTLPKSVKYLDLKKIKDLLCRNRAISSIQSYADKDEQSDFDKRHELILVLGIEKNTTNNEKIEEGIIQISWVIIDMYGYQIKKKNIILNRQDLVLHPVSINLNGIGHFEMETLGVNPVEAFKTLIDDLYSVTSVLTFNIETEIDFICSEARKFGLNVDSIYDKQLKDFKTLFIESMNIYNKSFEISLPEVYYLLFNKRIFNFSNAFYKSILLLTCYLRLNASSTFLFKDDIIETLRKEYKL